VERIGAEIDLPEGFPPEVVAAATRAAARGPTDPTPRAERTDLEMVTVDPPGSMDLDQAMHLADLPDGGVRVHYAIADVAAFVDPGDPVDREARARGETLYGPERSLPLHPPALSEDAASLLPGQVRPALLWEIEVGPDGLTRTAAVRRARVRTVLRLDYERAQALLDAGEAPPALAPLARLGPLLVAAETARGGVSLPIPEQEVRVEGERWSLAFRSMLPVERWNAQVSLLTGMAAARIMLDAGVGVVRTLPPPADEDLARLRRTARALGVPWAEGEPHAVMVHGLNPSRPAHAAMLAACQRLLRGSGYRAFDGDPPDGDLALHAGLASPYAHVTAPLRRLVDRFALEACVAACAGRPAPGWVREGLPDLPETMARSGRRASTYEGAVTSLVEAAVLAPHVGGTIEGTVVTRDAGAPHRGLLMLDDPAVAARIAGPEGSRLPLGERVRAVLVEADVDTRTVRFAPA
ncbi:MAG: RNB domain-containing ribonuclease, partial [Miltoncostaeaceae bacterium]